MAFYDPDRNRWLNFKNPARIIKSYATDEVNDILSGLQDAVNQGYYAAGFISYESAPAFDDAFKSYPPGDFPLVWFGLFPDSEESQDLHISSTGGCNVGEWHPEISAEEYAAAIAVIRDHLEQGNTYQVNFSYRQRAEFSGDPMALFYRMVNLRNPFYSAYIDIGSQVICSASPELFFLKENGQVISRPMKGTTKRGRTLQEDGELAKTLYHSEKNRAENVMIVDMIRNDLGRVAKTGTVKVPELFTVEKHQNVWQMTSTVECRTDASIRDVFQALFPCASITGAPKVSTTKIIAELEKSPRNIYTGGAGFITPDGKSQFNVAIRTALVDKINGIVEYGTGGGIVWDSVPEEEYAESVLKTGVLYSTSQRFRLFESLLWEPEDGFFLQDYHYQRMTDSADYFDFPFDERKWKTALESLKSEMPSETCKVRIVLDETGEFSTDFVPLKNKPVNSPVCVKLAENPIDETNRLLYHKTTCRDMYTSIKDSMQNCDDVIFRNSKSEITESTRANIVVKRHGELLTPPVESGLLPGTFRQWLLDNEKIREKIITVNMLKEAEELWLINSVQRWMKAVLD